VLPTTEGYTIEYHRERMRPASAVLAALVSLALAACHANQPPQPPPLSTEPAYVPPDAPSVAAATIDATPAPRAAGAACATAADCDSGICEGPGCDGSATGRCAAERRACTMDLIEYCGCDGQTFQASGSCPKRRYAQKGACPTPLPPPPKKAAGDACLSPDECASGVCAGKGCGDDTPGRCADPAARCARNVMTMCDCHGTTFQASSTCPGRRFAHPGKC
jgi:hypothetical protein